MANEVIQLYKGYLEQSNPVRARASVSLVKTKDYNLLVDLGSPWTKIAVGSGLEPKLKKNNLCLDNISNIILTHNHPDHTGLLHVFKGKPVWVYGSDSIYVLDSPESYFLPCEDNFEFSSGVKIIKTGGHETKGDQSVLVETEKGLTAIVGDLFLTEQEYRENIFLWPPNNEELALASRKKLRKLKPRHIVPGHGKMFSV